MPQDYTLRDYNKEPRLKPRQATSQAALLESQGISRWIRGPTMPYGFTPRPSRQAPKQPGAANRIPLEIASHISSYLDVKDLGRAAMAWRPVAQATNASPEFIKLECGKYSLLVNDSLRWPPDTTRMVRDRMEQYNFAWSTLLYSGSQDISIPGTTQDTPWAGSNDWKSGHTFMGESNGYMYNVATMGPPGAQMQARVCVYQLPSLRTGETDLRRTEFNVVLRSHFVKAVTVDPVGQVVAILEFNNNAHDQSPGAFLHVYNLNGRHMRSVQITTFLKPAAEVAHMELNGEMVCIVTHYPSYRSLIGTASDVFMQNWVGQTRFAAPQRCHGTDDATYCTGFQFITEDLWIATEKGKTDWEDGIPTHFIRVGHVRRQLQTVVKLRDTLGKGYTPNNVSLIRNASHYSPVSGMFYANPASRLFGIKYEYRNLKLQDHDTGNVTANCCLFGRATIEMWLGIGAPPGPSDSLHWLHMPIVNNNDASHQRSDPTNCQGIYLIGRRLFWAAIWPQGWSFHLIDYNPGAGKIISSTEPIRGNSGHWCSATTLFGNDPYAVSISTTIRLSDLLRVVPTEDGILLKQQHGIYKMLMM
ncbi:hypothetical protein DFH08DRAFT_1083084 [Mycena albidolilacea]|uniref:F-box domain-containing protein n=1 Tax=Mycena albidolilacea TaxID=1033008 RepID=A0AAD7EMI1_9AGAR|nr:hypothetical protein DFH08DRAFT_1083084 [Mycena albidolilacea]